MSPAMYSGGKGGSMPQMQGGAGKGGSGGGFGDLDMTNSTIGGPPNMTSPDAPPPVAQPAPAAAPQGPNALEQGLGQMNQGTDWFSQAMNWQAPTAAGPDMQGLLGQLSSARGGGYQASMMQAPGQDLYSYDPALAQAQSYAAAQLKDQDLSGYMNPYTQNVIDSAMGDLDKSRQQALNSTGAAASAGGAFGGDRHGIMEAQNNSDYMDSVARTSSQLRNQAYMNAQNAAMGDVSAMNQQRASNAGMAQQAGLSNQAAQNARDQFVGGTANSNAMQTAMSNQQAANQAKALEAQLAAQASMANASSRNGFLGQLAGLQQQNNQFNAQQGNQQFANQMQAAGTLYGMGNDRWNMGQDAINNMGQVGNQIDNINQTLIDQQYQMMQQQLGSPYANYNNMLGALGALGGGGTQTYTPGKMDYMQMGAGLGGAALMSDAGLKDNLKPIAKINGFQLYTWKWNEKAREIGCDHEPTFGVVAQEVRELRPEAILEGSDGYLMVDYKKLPEIARTVAMGGQ